MRINQLELVSKAILGDINTLKVKAKLAYKERVDPQTYGLAAILSTFGNDKEVSGFRSLSNYEIVIMNSLLKATLTTVARQILQVHPELAAETLNHKAIVKHLKTGPLKRLSPEDQAIKSLRSLLTSSGFFINYQNKGFLDWDNGDAQAAMVIYYGWRKVVTSKRGKLESVHRMHKDARKILNSLMEKYYENPFIHLINYRFKLSWDDDGRIQRADMLPALEKLAVKSDDKDRNVDIRLVSLKSLVDFGLRFREPQRVITALYYMQKIIIPEHANHPYIMLTRAWAEARGGEKQTAKRLAMEIAQSDKTVNRVSAAQLLEAVGNTEIANKVYAQVSKEFLPRANLLVLQKSRL